MPLVLATMPLIIMPVMSSMELTLGTSLIPISGIVLLGLPPVLFAAIYYLNPDYIEILFVDPLGKKMLAVAIFLQLVGALVIKKIINIKV